MNTDRSVGATISYIASFREAAYHRLRVLKLLIPAMIPRLRNEAAGFGEVVLRGDPGIGTGRLAEKQPGTMQVDVDDKQLHRAALGNVPGLVEIALGAVGAGAGAKQGAVHGAGEEAVDDEFLCSSLAEAGNSLINCGLRISDFGLGTANGRRRIGDGIGVQDRAVEGSAGEGEVIEGDVEERIGWKPPPPCLDLHCAISDGAEHLVVAGVFDPGPDAL